jgi:ABC-2 type transport system permease protein
MLLAVITKELRQTVRDRRMMALLLAAPAIQLVMFGMAVDLDVDRVPTVVVDLDHSHASRTHVHRLMADGTLRLAAQVTTVAQAERMLETGDAAVVLVVPRGFERDVVRGRTARVQVILDGSNPNRASVAGAAVAGYFAERAQEEGRSRVLRLAALNGASPRIAQVAVHTRVWFNPRLETSIYMVPGVMAMLLLVVTTIVTAMGLARERERGTLEQILVTPVPASVLILGKILPFAAFGLFDFVLALVVGAYVFEMPIRGDLGVLTLATLLYLLTTLGAGLLISTLSRTQQQAFMGGFLFMVPAALLSGVMTPIESMPTWLQPFTMVNPLRHYAEVTRAVLLRGAGFDELHVPLFVLAVMGLVVFTTASIRFRRTVG